MKRISEIWNTTDDKQTMTPEQLAKLDMRFPYPPGRVTWCSDCCSRQDRKDFARIKDGIKDWSDRQKPANVAMPGSSLCESCHVAARYGAQDATRNRFGGQDDR